MASSSSSTPTPSEVLEAAAKAKNYRTNNAVEIPIDCLAHVVLDGHQLDRRDWDRIKDIRIKKAFADHPPCRFQECAFCEKRSAVQEFYKGTVSNVMVELWEMDNVERPDNMLQWLPRELLGDLWEDVQKSNGRTPPKHNCHGGFYCWLDLDTFLVSIHCCHKPLPLRVFTCSKGWCVYFG